MPYDSHGYRLHRTCRAGVCSVQSLYLIGNILSLPSSIGSAGDLAKKMDAEATMEVSITASMGVPFEAPTEGTVVDWKEKDNA